jgi:hypothetical protein
MSSASTLLSAPASTDGAKFTRSVSLNHNLPLAKGNERQGSTLELEPRPPKNTQRERSVGASAATADGAAQALLALNAASSARVTASRPPALPKIASGAASAGPPQAADKSEAAPHEISRYAFPHAQEDSAITASATSSNSSARVDLNAHAGSSVFQPLPVPEVVAFNARKTTRDRQRIVRLPVVQGSTGTSSASASYSVSDTGISSATTRQFVSPLDASSDTSIHDGSQGMLAAAAAHFVSLDAAEGAPVDRPHACSKCLCQFTRSSHLVDHMRAKHDGAKPFSCDQVRLALEAKLSDKCAMYLNPCVLL